MSGSGRQGIWSRLAMADFVAGTAGFVLASWGFDVLVLGLTFDLWLLLHGMSVCITGVTFWLAMLHFEDPARTGVRWYVRKFFLACGIILMVQSVMTYFLRIEPDHPAVLMGSAIVVILLLAALKSCFAPVPPSGVLFLGFDSFTEKMARHMQPAAVGILHEDPAAVPADLPYLGKPARLAEVAESMRPGRIVVSGNRENSQVPARLLLDLRLSDIAIDDGLASYEEFFGRACWRRMETSALLFSPFLTTHRLVMSVQAIYTNLAGLALLLVSLPLLVAAAAAVALGSGRGPVLERIECLGFQGIPFHMLRFRTHRRNGTGTWIGRLLTRLHMVDLPQLINVVRGEMTFIGPPPVRKEFSARIAQLIPFYSARFTAKPGMLGWSQCQLAGSAAVPDESVRLEYDLYYVQEVMPSLDFEILIRSIFRTGRPRL